MLTYTCFVCVLLWNFAWTYDIYLTVNKPLIYSETFVFYYKLVVYATSIIVGLCVFFPNIDLFTRVRLDRNNIS